MLAKEPFFYAKCKNKPTPWPCGVSGFCFMTPSRFVRLKSQTEQILSRGVDSVSQQMGALLLVKCHQNVFDLLTPFQPLC